MLEALLWITGFLLLSVLTWLAGKHYGEKIAMHRTMERHGFKDSDFLSSPLDHLVNEDDEEDQKNEKGAGLYLVAKDGNLLDAPEENTLTEEKRRSL